MGVSKCPLASEGLNLLAPAPTCSNLQARLAALSTGGREQCCRGAGLGRSRALLTNYRCVGGTEALDGRAGGNNLTPPIRQLARALAPYSPPPLAPVAFKRGGLLGLP